MKSLKLMAGVLALGIGIGTSGAADGPVPKAGVLETYANIAAAKYSDSLMAAGELGTAVADLVVHPSAEALQAAKAAWLKSRVPYQQTEVYRFGNAIVDDWEGKVNAWPLDEGLIDYVDASYGGPSDENELAVLNVVANPTFMLSGADIDATRITPELLQDSLHEADGVEANVSTGYHAIEFLLWGQDLNGHGSGAGNRPWTDYATGDACTGGNCDRRAEYLQAATDSPDLRPRMDGGPMGGRRRSALRPHGRPGFGHRRDSDRHGVLVLRRTGRRADAAGPDAERPGGGA